MNTDATKQLRDKLLLIFTFAVFAFTVAPFAIGCNEPETYRFCENEGELVLPAACDISIPACQQAVFDAVKCLHDSPMTMPAVQTISELEYRKELGLYDAETDTDSGTDTEEAETEMDYWNESLKMLGLITPESSSETEIAESFATSTFKV